MGQADGSFFKKPVFSPFKTILSIFQKKGLGGSGWVQVGLNGPVGWRAGGLSLDYHHSYSRFVVFLRIIIDCFVGRAKNE